MLVTREPEPFLIITYIKIVKCGINELFLELTVYPEDQKKKKIRPKIKPIATPQESDNAEASSDSNTAISPKDSEEEAQGREVSIRTELGFGEFAHSPPRSR